MTLPDVDFSKRLVIALGNEHFDVSESLLEASDVKFSIPMIGFVQSLNLSVSVAVTLYIPGMLTENGSTGGIIMRQASKGIPLKYTPLE